MWYNGSKGGDRMFSRTAKRRMLAVVAVLAAVFVVAVVKTRLIGQKPF